MYLAQSVHCQPGSPLFLVLDIEQPARYSFRGVVAYLCDLGARGGNAVKGQVHALGHVLAIAEVDQEADVHQIVVGAGLDVRSNALIRNL